MQDPRAIVAGFDGSAEAAAAVRWAVRQARAAGCPLHVVHCSLWPLLTRHLGPVPGVSGSGLEQSAQSILEDGVACARAEGPGLDIRGTLLHGLPAQLLAETAAGARMLVVGSRGLGGFLGLLVGSVSLELAATAACPVAVIREDLHPGGPVVVAVDGSGSPAALEDASHLAARAGAKLIVVHVRQAHARFKHGGPETEAPGDNVLQTAVRAAAALAPAVDVQGKLLSGNSVAAAILEASEGAAVLVVGTKGYGAVKETLGSTAHAVLHHARGPVLVSRRGG